MRSQRNRLYRIWCIVAIACTVFLATTIAGAQTHEPGSVVELFDGKTLDHFYTFLKDRGKDSDPKKVFTVQKGLLRISGEEWGCITSHEEFDNFHLVAEFKWGEKTWGDRTKAARDSGILIHSTGPDGAYSGTWMHSIELQIIEGGTGDVLVVGDGTVNFRATAPLASVDDDGPKIYRAWGTPVEINKGRIDWFARDPKWTDTKGFRGARDIEKPVGEWNRLECIAVGRTVTVILNGVVVNQCIDVWPRRGKIQVQSEGAEIFFRKITLTTLAREYDHGQPPSVP